MKILFFVLALFFLPQSFATNFARVPYYAGQSPSISGYYPNPATVLTAGVSPANVSALSSVGLNVGVSQTAGYTPQLNTAGAAVLSTSAPVTVAPPAGSVPTAAQSSSALALAGAGGIAAGTLIADVPLGSGAGSLAANLALPALGFVAAGAGAAGMVLGSPLLLAGAAAAGVGTAGYSLYQALKGQGVTVDSSGVAFGPSAAVESVSPSVPASYSVFGWGGSYSSPLAACTAYKNTMTPASNYTWGTISTVSGGTCGIMGNVIYDTGIKWIFNSAAVCPVASPVYTYDVASAMCVRASSSAGAPVSDTALQSAILAALASNASIALDGANLARQNGIDLQAAVVASGAQANINALHLESAFSKLSNSIDSLGNTQAELARTVVDFPACSNGDPSAIGNTGACAPVVSVQKVPLTNNTPQSVNTISQAPAIQTAINTATAAQQKTQTDLCEAHPDALACSNDANVSDVPLAPLTVKNLSVTLSPVNVSSIAACPAPIPLGGGKFFTFDGICTWAGMLKPLLLAFAWLTAGAVVFRGRPYA